MAKIVVHGEAVLPNALTARIVGWSEGAREVSVAVRVGRLGHAEEERRFVQVLKELMTGEPAPARGGSFELPPLSPADTSASE